MHAALDENHHPTLQVYSRRNTVEIYLIMRLDTSIICNHTKIRSIEQESDFWRMFKLS